MHSYLYSIFLCADVFPCQQPKTQANKWPWNRNTNKVLNLETLNSTSATKGKIHNVKWGFSQLNKKILTPDSAGTRKHH